MILNYNNILCADYRVFRNEYSGLLLYNIFDKALLYRYTAVSKPKQGPIKTVLGYQVFSAVFVASMCVHLAVGYEVVTMTELVSDPV